MKKEVFLAISIGFIIGLILTYFVYQSKLANMADFEIISPLPEKSTEDQQVVSISQILTITSPLDQSISKEGKTKVSGTTSPLSWVIILGEKGEKVVQADKEGSFETEILLDSGENEIGVTSINEAGDEINKTVTIVYSTVEI